MANLILNQRVLIKTGGTYNIGAATGLYFELYGTLLSQDASQKKSTVKWEVDFKGSAGYVKDGNTSSYKQLTNNGETYKLENIKIGTQNRNTTIFEYTQTYSHNSSGNLTINDLVFKEYFGAWGTTMTTGSAATAVFPQIKQLGSITAPASLAYSYTAEASASDSKTLTISNPDGYYLVIRIFSGTATASTGWTYTRKATLTNGTSQSYTLAFSKAEITDMISKQSIGSGDTATINPVIKIISYRDSARTSIVGTTTYSGSCSVSITGLAPSVSSSSYGDSNATSRTLTGNTTTSISSAVKGLTTMTYSHSIALKNGATISSATCNGTACTISGSTVSGTATINDSPVNFIIKDSRGNQLSISKTLTITYITPLSTTSVNIARTSNVVANEASIEISGNCWGGNFGNTSNNLTFQYKIWAEDETEPAYSTAESVSITSSNTFSINKTLSSIDYTKSYKVRIKIYDKVKTIETPSGSPRLIGKGLPIACWTKDTFRVNGSLYEGNNRVYTGTVGNGTLTIQKNGTNVATFSANQSGAATANITVPTTFPAYTKILWERSGTWNSSFDAQSIELNTNISNFKMIEIFYLAGPDATLYMTSSRLYNNYSEGDSTTGLLLLGTGSGKITSRLVSNINGTNITFSSGRIANTYGSNATDNGRCIPVRVVGWY